MTNDSQNQALELVEPSASAIGQIERANIDVQISTAHRFPRMLSKVKADMLSFATLDEETAASCFYTLPRGGKTIQGPSVRLAEIAVACYGNLRAGARPIETVTTGDNPHVIIQAVAHDLEKNVAITIEKRRRITKKRGREYIDEDDITLAVNAGSAIAFRDAVFKVVPLALIKPVYEQAKQVAVGKASSLAEKRTKIIDRLKQMGATEPRILAAVECAKAEDITLEKLEILIGLGTALKDGEVTLEQAFPDPKKIPDEAAKAGPAGGITSAANGGTKEGVQDASGHIGTEGEQVDRDKIVEELKSLMLDHGVSEAKVFDYAKRAKLVPEGVAELFALPTETIAKLKFVVPTPAMKGGAK